MAAERTDLGARDASAWMLEQDDGRIESKRASESDLRARRGIQIRDATVPHHLVQPDLERQSDRPGPQIASRRFDVQ